MNFQRWSLVWILSLITVGSLTTSGLAEDSLGLKVELRNGPKGPIRQPVVFAGERLDFCLHLSGLVRNKKNEFEISARSELRDAAGDLLLEVPLKEFTSPSQLGTRKFSLPLSYFVPIDQSEGELSAIFVATDLVSGKEIKQEVRIEVKKATSAYPVMVEYLVANSQGSSPGSGRFTTGDSISLQFWLSGISNAKRIKSKLEVFQKGMDNALSVQDVSAEISAAYRKLNALQGGFSLLATEPFVGKIRLTVTDDAGNTNSLEMPLEVTGPLELGEAVFLVEKPTKSSEETKKE